MLSENKFSKYLIYAIGEIVMVVIGILIALQVNTWKIEKVNKNSEEKYLSNIVLDLGKDIANLNNLMEFKKKDCLVINKLLTILTVLRKLT